MKKNIRFIIITVIRFVALIAVVLTYSVGDDLTVQASSNITVIAESTQVHFPDQKPTIVQGRTLVPIRPPFETLGFTVTWEEPTQTAVLTKGLDTLRITIGTTTFMHNGVAKPLDVPAQLIGGRTNIPIRLPLEAVGYTVTWNEQTQTITITKEQQTHGLDWLVNTNPHPQYMITYRNYWYNMYFNLTQTQKDELYIAYSQSYLSKINDYRVEHDLNPVQWCPILTEAAMLHAEDMVTSGLRIGHMGSDGSTHNERAQRAGWTGGFIGENAVGCDIISMFENMFNIPHQFVGTSNLEKWHNSEGHRRTMQMPNATHAGIGMYYGEDGQGQFYLKIGAME